MRTPSLADFGTHQDSFYPELWDGCVHAYCPSLGITGDRIFDFSGRSKTGTFTNLTASSWSLSVGKPQLDFSYTGATSVTLGSFAPFVYDKVTLAAWVYRTEDRVDARVFSAGTTLGYSLGTYGPTGRMQGQFTSTAFARDASSTVTLNKWFHVVFTYANDVPRLYIDGSLQVTGTSATATVSTASLAHRIGAASAGNGNYWPGSIDDLMVYDRELSLVEIETLARYRAVAYTKAARKSIFFVGLSPDAGVSGSSSASTSSSTSVAAGLLSFEGSSSVSTASSTSSASASESFTGSSAVAADASYSTAAGEVAFAGSSAVTTSASTPSAAGSVDLLAAASASAADATSAASGGMSISGDALALAGVDTSSASGAIGVAGSATATTSGDTAISAGLLSNVGAVSASTADSTLSASGTVAISGQANATTQNATSIATGGNGTFGDGASQLADATSQCLGELLFTGTASGSTTCQCGSSGTIQNDGSVSASTGDSQASASALVASIGVGSSTTASASSATGAVTVVAIATVVAESATSAAVGSVPTVGAAVITLQPATSLAVGMIIQTDLELTGAVELAQCDGRLSAPMVGGRVREDRLEGRKIWP